jgi:dolichol kinase
MKTATVKQIGRRLRQAGKQLSIERVLAEFQSALLCLDQFGVYAGLIIGFFVVASFLLQAARSVAEKGVI